MNSKLSLSAFNYRGKKYNQFSAFECTRRATKATLFLHGNQFMYRLSYGGDGAGGGGGSSTHFLVQMFEAISVALTHSFIAAILYERKIGFFMKTKEKMKSEK